MLKMKILWKAFTFLLWISFNLHMKVSRTANFHPESCEKTIQPLSTLRFEVSGQNWGKKNPKTYLSIKVTRRRVSHRRVEAFCPLVFTVLLHLIEVCRRHHNISTRLMSGPWPDRWNSSLSSSVVASTNCVSSFTTSWNLLFGLLLFPPTWLVHVQHPSTRVFTIHLRRLAFLFPCSFLIVFILVTPKENMTHRNTLILFFFFSHPVSFLQYAWTKVWYTGFLSYTAFWDLTL